MNKRIKYLADIRWLIFIFFLLRLYGITNPPLEANQNWRQCTTNMYARNFLEVDNNPLYCRVDMAGDLTGITAKEFPLFNYLIYLAAELLGWQHWYGRLISLVVSSFGIWFFYLLVKKYVESPDQPFLKSGQPSIAYSASLVLLCSIWFGHSRIIMPDTFSVSLVLVGLWFAMEWLHRGGGWRLLLFGLLGTMGALSKLPSGFLLVVLALPIFDKSILWQRKLGLVAVGAMLLASCGWWYFYWLPHIIETYGFEQYPMRSVAVGMWEIFGDIKETAERFYQSALKGYLAFGAYLLGLGLAIYKKEWRLLGLFSLFSIVFIGYMFKSGSSFYHHNYYIIPFVPVMALIAGFAIAQIQNLKLQYFLLFAIAVECIANQQDGFRIKKTELPKLQLETIADSLSQRKDLVAFFHPDGNPQELYFAHRKGWMMDGTQIVNASYITGLAGKGCKLFFFNKKWRNEKVLPATELVFEDDNYLVFRPLE